MELAGERLVPLSATSYSNFIADTIKSGSLKSDLENQGIGFGKYWEWDVKFNTIYF